MLLDQEAKASALDFIRTKTILKIRQLTIGHELFLMLACTQTSEQTDSQMEKKTDKQTATHTHIDGRFDGQSER